MHQLEVRGTKYSMSRAHKKPNQTPPPIPPQQPQNTRAKVRRTSFITNSFYSSPPNTAMPLSQPLLLAQTIPKSIPKSTASRHTTSSTTTAARNVLAPLQSSLRTASTSTHQHQPSYPRSPIQPPPSPKISYKDASTIVKLARQSAGSSKC